MAPKLLFLDFETYYDKEYSLRKMTPAEYILDSRFETIMVAAISDDQLPPRVVEGPDVPAFLAEHPPENTVTVTFNALFDAAILSYRYNYVPRMTLDAMNIARAVLGHKLRRLSLDSVSQHLGLPPKGGAIAKVVGYGREEIKRRGLWAEFAAYCCDDVAKCATIFHTLIKDFPANEWRIMDLVIRAAIQPVLRTDTQLLGQHLTRLVAQKDLLLAKAGVGKDDLMSAAKFEGLLRERGVTVETKVSPTGKLIAALAKTDDFMQRLLEHEDPAVQALASARLGHKSTLQETRTQRLLSIANLPWPSYCRGNMPIPLRYSGAHTHRLSGDWGMNMQNLPRKTFGVAADAPVQGDELRRALVAPEGYAIVVSDLSQIEARLTAWLAGCKTLLDIFANGGDPYADLASAIFGRPIVRKVDKVEGFIGKTGILGLGYGAGLDKFCYMVESTSKTFGVPLEDVGWTRELGEKAHKLYRKRYWEIPELWERLDRAIWALMGRAKPVQIGPVTISQDQVMGPNGLPMKYDKVRRDEETREFGFWYGGQHHKLYGAKLLENIIQYLARIIIMNAASRLASQGLRFVLQTHDELVYVVKQTEVDKTKDLVQTEMIRRPSWGKDIPLGAETGSGVRYGEAK